MAKDTGRQGAGFGGERRGLNPQPSEPQYKGIFAGQGAGNETSARRSSRRGNSAGPRGPSYHAPGVAAGTGHLFGPLVATLDMLFGEVRA